VLAIATLPLLPSRAWSDNTGATRIPPQVEAARGGPAGQADPGTLDSDSEAAQPGSAGRVVGSKTLNGGPKDPGERRIENTANGLSAPGGLFGLDPGAPAADSQDKVTSAPASGPTPDLHVVQKGDTLWSLCSKYFNDPWRWPRLWAANPVITNPHWIFPGDIVRLGGGNASAGLPAPSPAAVPARHGMTSVNRMGAYDGNALLLREMGFIEAKDLDQAATITGSREEKIMLSTADQAYLRYPKGTTLRAGERYSVFSTDTDTPVVDSTTGKTYGHLVRILGDVVINQIAENDVARGTLMDTVVPIERGARVSPFVHQFKRIEPRPSDVNLEARVIATFEPNMLLGTGHFVVLNRGKRDGVQVGNRTFVIRRGDGYRANLEEWEIHDPESPKEVVGEILVLDVRDDASVAWIARTNKELKVGELTEMRKGH
jgi:LysM repeat protein